MIVKGLKNKILLSMVLLLALLGLTTAFINKIILSRVLKVEFQERGVSHARSVASGILVDVLTRNTARLNKFVYDEKKFDKDTAYIFIMDPSSHILAHTFQNGFPVDLIKANGLSADRPFNIQLLDTQLGLVYDIAVPIFLDKNSIGQVRLGLLQKGIQSTIIVINFIILGTALLVIIIGIFLALRLSLLITRPVSELVRATQSIQKGDFSAKIDVKTRDEIGFLARAFNKMAERLNHLIEEKTHLTKFKERERIAFDLHDGCAQDLASIIKRLEYCEKMIKIEPQKSDEELKILREDIKNILAKTRKAIFDLKSQEGVDSDLLSRLIAYIKDYEKINAITVRLHAADSLKDIDYEKANSIFYIITEALNNTRKHSLAKNVDLYIEQKGSDELVVAIKDDGQGFDTNMAGSSVSASGGFGLNSMRQRASSIGGELVIDSTPNGGGTEIRITIPYRRPRSFL